MSNKSEATWHPDASMSPAITQRAEYENVLLAKNLLEAQRERDEARAERDALAHVIEQARAWCQEFNNPDAEPYSFADEMLTAAGSLFGILATAPAASLTLRDAEVWDEGNHAARADRDAAARYGSADTTPNPYRAAAMRAEGK